jgi:hypothetical protein
MTKSEERELRNSIEDIHTFQKIQLKRIDLIHEKIVAIANWLREDRELQSYDMRGRKRMPRQ